MLLFLDYFCIMEGTYSMLLTSMSSATTVTPCLFDSACCQMTALLYVQTCIGCITHSSVLLTQRYMLVPDYHHSELFLKHLLQ